jgi:hypothetical protein
MRPKEISNENWLCLITPKKAAIFQEPADTSESPVRSITSEKEDMRNWGKKDLLTGSRALQIQTSEYLPKSKKKYCIYEGSITLAN